MFVWGYLDPLGRTLRIVFLQSWTVACVLFELDTADALELHVHCVV